jgi:hypothetical protein
VKSGMSRPFFLLLFAVRAHAGSWTHSSALQRDPKGRAPDESTMICREGR